MTISIAGFCETLGMTGVAITTSSISVGSRCPWVRAHAGAVATQNITDPTIGNEVLDLMQEGLDAVSALTQVMNQRPHAEYRQVTAVDYNGITADFSGSRILGTHSVARERHCVAAGNLLFSTGVPRAMVGTFSKNQQMHLAKRLVLSLEAGISAGGEEGPTHSAALLVAHDHPWPLVDLRVDWSDAPVNVLLDLWQRYEPQMQDYLNRAINPDDAPTYGVPGDP